LTHASKIFSKKSIPKNDSSKIFFPKNMVSRRLICTLIQGPVSRATLGTLPYSRVARALGSRG